MVFVLLHSLLVTTNECSAEGVPSVELVQLPNAQFLSLEVGVGRAPDL